MRKPVALITGANGEMGQSLIHEFAKRDEQHIVALDLNPIDRSLRQYCVASITGDIRDQNLLERLISEFEIHEIYHLAALLSTRAEYTPDTAHSVNVNGTLNLLQLAHEQSRWHGHQVKFLFPSSIAAYGLPDRETKSVAGKVKEDDWNFPTTMYGCNKRYCEQLGKYFTFHYRQLANERQPSGVDFRSIRFPGLISADTLPHGGTSDYGPEMLHAAAQGEPYACFVEESAKLPFMVMPDAIKSIVQLASVDAERLSQRIYNVTSFSLTAGEIRDRVLKAWPDAKVTFEPDKPRAQIVASWPGDVNDRPAREDWEWQPDYDLDRAFDEYLVPKISARYAEQPSEV